MARRRQKKRTQTHAPTTTPASNGTQTPRTMVLRMGASAVGASVSQLVTDVRAMLAPDTAARLKERRKNRLRDYVTMCGPLGVSHLLLFSKSEASGNTNLRVAVTPRGPTLSFRVEQYSLCKDVARAIKRPRGGGKEFLSPPLLVMNNFTTPESQSGAGGKRIPKKLESLTTTVFQSLFPAISPQTTALSSIRRVLLLNREPCDDANLDEGAYTITLRHYAITTKTVGVSRPIRRLNAAEKLLHAETSTKSKARKAGVPNLHRLDDIADFMIGNDGEGYTTDVTSGSEVDTDGEVEVVETRAKRLLGKRQRESGAARRSRNADGSAGPGVERKAVKLVELGPRMKLRLLKVEEGVCAGKVMWHDLIEKSADEERQLDERWETKRREREERRRVQKENVERKRGPQRGAKAGDGTAVAKESVYDGMDLDDWDDEDLMDDAEEEEEGGEEESGAH